MTDPRRIVIVGYEDAMLLDIACPADAFHVANRLGIAPRYDVRIATLGRRPIRACSGLTLAAHAALERVRAPIDTLVVPGGTGDRAASSTLALLDQVRRLAAGSRRIVSVCTGATVLAATGLLDGRRVATHWATASQLAQAYPRVKVDPIPLYIKDEKIYTSAGITSALDLSLALIAEDHGTSLARSVARLLVTYLQRPASQAQVSLFVAPSSEHDVIRGVVDVVISHLADNLDPQTLAAGAGVSARHLTRLFHAELGTTPSRYVRSVRTEAAAHLLTSTHLPVTSIARRVGFGTAEALRLAFVDRFNIPPSTYRLLQRRNGLVSGDVHIPTHP